MATVMEHTEITQAQSQLFAIAQEVATMLDKVTRAELRPIGEWLRFQYGGTPPTYEQFWSDRRALKEIAKRKGLVDDQTVRKAYNAAVKETYGKLPESPHEHAVRARERKAAKAAEEAEMAPPLPPRKEVVAKERQAKRVERCTGQLRHMLEKFDYGTVLMAFSTILKEHRETEREAPRVETLGSKMAAMLARRAQKSHRQAHSHRGAPERRLAVH